MMRFKLINSGMNGSQAEFRARTREEAEEFAKSAARDPKYSLIFLGWDPPVLRDFLVQSDDQPSVSWVVLAVDPDDAKREYQDRIMGANLWCQDTYGRPDLGRRLGGGTFIRLGRKQALPEGCRPLYCFGFIHLASPLGASFLAGKMVEDVCALDAVKTYQEVVTFEDAEPYRLIVRWTPTGEYNARGCMILGEPLVVAYEDANGRYWLESDGPLERAKADARARS